MIRQINLNEITPASKMFTRAFNNYIEFELMYKGMEGKERLMEAFFSSQMKALFKTGDIFVSDDLMSGYYGYDSAKTSYILLLIKTFVGMTKAASKLSKEDRILMKKNASSTEGTGDPFWYKNIIKGRHYHFQILGVDPENQGKGNVKKLLGPVIEKCDKLCIPIILDTHVDVNVAIYKHYGFEIAKTLVSKNGALTRTCMVHYPKA